METEMNTSVLTGRKIAVLTLGCKVNQYETDGMREKLEKIGCEFVDFSEAADIYLIHTCSVTNMAERKSRQMLHRAKKQNPGAVVAAIGCYVQTAPDEVMKDNAVDLIIGNNCKKNIVLILEQYLENRTEKSENAMAVLENQTGRLEAQNESIVTKKCQIGEERDYNEILIKTNKECLDGHEKSIKQNEERILSQGLPDHQVGEAEEQSVSTWVPVEKLSEYEELSLTHMQEHTRAYVKIQDGCNQFCSYCIIPYVRGRIRSRKPENIMAEVCHLAEEGCKEVVLTGIHLSSYGKDWNKGNISKSTPGVTSRTLDGTDLLNVIRQISDIEGILRIRLGSLEPRIITEDFVRGLKEIPKICPHFHLSLQSGCNETLKRMNRKYTIEEYRKSCVLLRQSFDRPAITTDVIVGFPGETEEEFQTTCRNLEELELYEIHVFKYSKRRGTVAENMPDQVSEQEKTRRSEVLLAMTARQKNAYEECFQGEEVQVLMEEKVEKNGKDWYVGHTERYMKVEVPAEQDVRNQIVNVRL